MSQNPEQPISPPQQALLDLFEDELKELRFPDINREVLAEAATRVREQADLVAQAEAALAAAREKLAESQDALLHLCAAGIVFLPGEGGTVQEIFQDACENYYLSLITGSPSLGFQRFDLGVCRF